MLKTKPLQYNDQLIEYQVQHRPAVTRRIHLELNANGSLRIIAPRRMSRRAIHKTLQKKVSRVARFLVDARTKQYERPIHRYVSGEMHLLLGHNFPLEVIVKPGKRGRVELIDGRIRIITTDAGAKHVSTKLGRWYRRQALQHFSIRLEIISHSAPWTGGQSPPLRLRKMKRTWGNCSSKGVVKLNTHLIKTPMSIVDSVIAHELCHLEEMNHDTRFYALLEGLNPDWRQDRARLRAQGFVYLLT